MGCGKVVKRTPRVHGNPLLDDEVKIMIDKVEEGMETHPDYTNYTVEAGSFTAWSACSCTYQDI